MDDFMNLNLNNAGNPVGEDGEEMLKIMNAHHNEGALFSIAKLHIKDYSKILDVGCGGGQNIQNLLKKSPTSIIYGVDYSDTAIKVSAETNQKEIAEQQVFLLQQSVSHLDFEDHFFDVVTAFETIYFWPDIEHDFKEVFRVLKQNGVFMIHVEAHTHKTLDKWNQLVPLKNKLTLNDIKQLLEKCHFKNIQSFTKENAEVSCVIAYK